MPNYQYEVRDKAGRVIKGKLDGADERVVTDKLRSMGYIILSLKQTSALNLDIKIGGRVKVKEVAIFARQFSTMINAGLSLTKCLTILAGQAQNATFKDVIGSLVRDVESGLSLSEAMGKHPKTFPPIFTNMVKAGETGGVLDEVLERVADSFERDLALKSRIKSAMTYPIAMGVLVVGILIAMLLFVIPTFETMFADMGSELPAMTQFLLDLSKFIAGPGGIFTLIGIVAASAAFIYWKKTEAGHLMWDSIKLRIPVIGNMVSKLSLSRFTRTFGTLTSAGVPILTALDIVADTVGNEVVAAAVRKARTSIKEGEAIAQPLAQSPIFPSMLVQMISVGEETGALDAMLNKVADFYDEEVTNSIEGITSLIEPVMMVVLGGVVGGMVVALYLPMFNIITLVQ